VRRLLCDKNSESDGAAFLSKFAVFLLGETRSPRSPAGM
jgi:hypothetical protein